MTVKVGAEYPARMYAEKIGQLIADIRAIQPDYNFVPFVSASSDGTEPVIVYLREKYNALREHHIASPQQRKVEELMKQWGNPVSLVHHPKGPGQMIPMDEIKSEGVWMHYEGTSQLSVSSDHNTSFIRPSERLTPSERNTIAVLIGRLHKKPKVDPVPKLESNKQDAGQIIWALWKALEEPLGTIIGPVKTNERQVRWYFRQYADKHLEMTAEIPVRGSEMVQLTVPFTIHSWDTAKESEKAAIKLIDALTKFAKAGGTHIDYGVVGIKSHYTNEQVLDDIDRQTRVRAGRTDASPIEASTSFASLIDSDIPNHRLAVASVKTVQAQAGLPQGKQMSVNALM